MGNTNLLCKKKRKNIMDIGGGVSTQDKKAKQAVVRAQMREEELWRMGLGNLGSRIFFCVRCRTFPRCPVISSVECGPFTKGMFQVDLFGIQISVASFSEVGTGVRTEADKWHAHFHSFGQGKSSGHIQGQVSLTPFVS